MICFAKVIQILDNKLKSVLVQTDERSQHYAFLVDNLTRDNVKVGSAVIYMQGANPDNSVAILIDNYTDKELETYKISNKRGDNLIEQLFNNNGTWQSKSSLSQEINYNTDKTITIKNDQTDLKTLIDTFIDEEKAIATETVNIATALAGATVVDPVSGVLPLDPVTITSLNTAISNINNRITALDTLKGDVAKLLKG
jgi:hypothetical protein